MLVRNPLENLTMTSRKSSSISRSSRTMEPSFGSVDDFGLATRYCRVVSLHVKYLTLFTHSASGHTPAMSLRRTMTNVSV